jgi:MATE family multidrug resistance protein
MQNARGPLVIVVTISLVNAGLDLWFVLGLKMTVAGVALASVLAEIAGLLAGALFVQKEMRNHQPVWEFAHYREISRYRALFNINGNLFLRSIALLFTFAFVTAQGARLGDVFLATNAVLMNFLYFMAYALDGIAHAAEALTGKAVGARNRQGLEIAVSRTLLWSGGFATLFSPAYFTVGPSIINLLSDLPEIRDVAKIYLPWLIAAPLLSVWCFLYDGVYVGITRAREMCIVMIFSTLLVFLPAWYLFSAWGNHGLWLALMLFMVSRGVGMHLWYRRMLSQNQLAG